MDTVATGWGHPSDEQEREREGQDLAGENLLAAFAGDAMAGTAMSFALELTVPGDIQVPLAGVSWVAVHPLHRRQGILRALMRAQLDDLHDRELPLAGLAASEAGIYSRYGYGTATWDSSWTMTRGAARHLADAGEGGTLELVDAQTAQAQFAVVHEQARRSQTGEVPAYPGWLREHTADQLRRGRHFIVWRDAAGSAAGWASYRLERKERYSAHATVAVDHLVAATRSAYLSLWSYLSDLDLTDTIRASSRPEHEPLQWVLKDRRQLEVTSVDDHLWMRLVDLPAALSQRRYAAEGAIVLEVTDPFCPWNEGRWILDGGPDGATCRPALCGHGAELQLDISTLGSLYLGGPPATRLAAAGLIDGDPQTLRKASMMFATGTDPWCSTWF